MILTDKIPAQFRTESVRKLQSSKFVHDQNVQPNSILFIFLFFLFLCFVACVINERTITEKCDETFEYFLLLLY